MKKSYLLLATLALMNISFGQTKSTGVVTLTTDFTLKIDVNNATNKATFTMTGPLSKWLSIGLDCNRMSVSTDCISYNTSLQDQYLCGGYCTPNTDPTNDLSTPIVTNPTTTTTKTIVFTRNLNTGDVHDYTFDYATLTGLNIIWSIGGSNTNQQHGSKGAKQLSFTTLGTEDFASLDKISVYPNPSNGIFTISKNNATQISKIKIFDTNAKLLKEIEQEVNSIENTVDLSKFSKGMYFMEISNTEDKVVKKIMLK
jgi:hypothetical protein